jgi:hypothetical protein
MRCKDAQFLYQPFPCPILWAITSSRDDKNNDDVVSYLFSQIQHVSILFEKYRACLDLSQNLPYQKVGTPMNPISSMTGHKYFG